MLLGKEYVYAFLARAVHLAERHGFEAEGYYLGEESGVMRSSRPGVHQTSIGRDGELVLRLRRNKRSVDVVVSSPADIASAIHKGREQIAYAKPNPLLYPLVQQPAKLPEESQNLQGVPRQFWDDLPAKQSAFRAISKAQAKMPSWYGAGCFLSAAYEIGTANSAGLLRYTAGYYSAFTVVTSGGRRQRQLTTYADAFARLPQEVDFQKAVDDAFAKARLTDELPLLEPLHGRSRIQMDVILSPNCVADWIRDASLTFSGYRIYNGESYVSARVRGKSRIASQDITLRENWRDPRSLQVPFDLEGRTRQKVILIDKGIYSGCVYDGMSAILAGNSPTGHSGFDLGTDTADMLVMDGQYYTFTDLVESCDRPALILTWPHYNSNMYEKEGMWTVTGHHGVFLAKGGRIVAVCPPTRLRMRTFDALRRVEMMTASTPIFDVERYPLAPPTSSVVPWMKIPGVEFINL